MAFGIDKILRKNPHSQPKVIDSPEICGGEEPKGSQATGRGFEPPQQLYTCYISSQKLLTKPKKNVPSFDPNLFSL